MTTPALPFLFTPALRERAARALAPPPRQAAFRAALREYAEDSPAAPGAFRLNLVAAVQRAAAARGIACERESPEREYAEASAEEALLSLAQLALGTWPADEHLFTEGLAREMTCEEIRAQPPFSWPGSLARLALEVVEDAAEALLADVQHGSADAAATAF